MNDVTRQVLEALEKLAAGIGTTVEKVFPWFVKQQVILAVSELAVGMFFLFLGIITAANRYRKSDFDKGNISAILFILGCFGVILSLMFLACTIPINISRILNPEYYAVKSLMDLVKP